MKQKLLYIFLLAQFLGFAQLTTIPDDNFEFYIETHDVDGFVVPVGDPEAMGNGIVGDNLVSSAKIANAQEIYMVEAGVTDLTGINEFTSLYQLYVYFNNIETIDVSIPSLWTLAFSGNGTTSMDISGSPGIENLVANDNLLVTIDLSNNAALDEVYLNDNLLTENLDFSSSPSITYLEVKNNFIESIDLRSRSSASIPFEFDATQNPNLSCVFVDNSASIPTGWVVDDGVFYVENEEECTALNVLDLTLDVGVYPNPSNGVFKIDSNQTIDSIEVVALSGKVVAQFNSAESYELKAALSGLHFLRIRLKNSVVVKKIIFE